MKSLTVPLVYRFIIMLILVVGLLGCALEASAQTTLFDSSLGAEIVISSNPENPSPNSEVFVSLESFAYDLDRLLITWFVDGVQTQTGVGQKNTLFTTKDIGEETIVEAVIRLTSGETISKTISIIPGSVDVLWESVDGYRPPFYKGKILPTRESKINVVAIPQISSDSALMPAKNFKYTWEHNFNIQGSLSGYGIDSFQIINSSVDRSEKVGVSILDRAGEHTAESQITIPLFEPEVLVYTDGEFGRSYYATGQRIAVQGAVNLIAEPYNFSVVQNDPRVLQYQWKAGGVTLTDPSGGILRNELRIEQPNNPGLVNIDVSVEHPLKIFQAVNRAININFAN